LTDSEKPFGSRASRLFNQAGESFERAEKAAGECVHFSYEIGGATVLLRFAGKRLVPFMTPGLAHLELKTETTQPALTINIWDGGPEGAGILAPPWLPQDQIARGEVLGLSDEAVRVAFNPVSCSLSLFDSRMELALHFVPQPEGLLAYERAAPLLAILNWWAQRSGRQVVHAAAIGNAEAGLLLAGRGGSGKTTTAVACLEAGLDYAGDDYCLLEDGTTPQVFSLYNSCKVEVGNMWVCPKIQAAARRSELSENGKTLLFLRELFPERMVSMFPLRAILVPRIVSAGPTRLIPVSVAEGLKALAPSTLFQLPGEDTTAFRTLATIVRKVPCYRLDLGPALDEIPGAIGSLLSSHDKQ
jgi:hypothetical protein